MKTYLGAAFGALILVANSKVEAAPLESCSTQKNCLVFTVKSLTSGYKCGGLTAGSEYEVCATLNLSNLGCVKAPTDTVSHTCIKSSSTCSSGLTGIGFKGSKETVSVPTGLIQCQTGKAGESLQFLFKDGKGCGDSVSTTSLGNGMNGSCAPRADAVSSCTGNKAGVECIWTVTIPQAASSIASLLAPTPAATLPLLAAPAAKSNPLLPDPVAISNPLLSAPVAPTNPLFSDPVSPLDFLVKAGGGGDPHFRTFDGTHYSFHGECDLIMARSPSFGDGLGLDVHIRTEIVTGWSRISNTVIRIGSDTFELLDDGSYYFNGNNNVPEPIKMAGKYTVKLSEEMVDIKGEAEKVKRSFASIDLQNYNNIHLTVFKKMISVRFNADLHDAAGMIGTRFKTGMIARDGQTVLTNPNMMGFEWQVTNTEPMLFHEVRAPQFPEQCKLPSYSSRLLMLSDDDKRRAEILCSHVSEDMKQFCIEDVELAGDSEFAHDGEAY